MQGAIRQIPCFLSTLLPSSHIGGGLHSLTTTVLLTECSIEYSIGLLPILHTVQSDRMPSHIRHVSQPPSSIWITTAAPSPPAGTHQLLPSSHTDPSSSARMGPPAGSLAATDSDRVPILTITVADAILEHDRHYIVLKLELYSYDLYRSDRLKLWASWSIDILTGRCTAYIVMVKRSIA